MRTAEDIIRRPLITEQSNAEIANGKYTFVVDKRATKVDIRMAVEKLFSVKVIKVNTMNYDGKLKRLRQGSIQGYRPDWKKAIVKIDLDPKPEAYLEKGGKKVATNIKYKTSIEEFGGAQ